MARIASLAVTFFTRRSFPDRSSRVYVSGRAEPRRTRWTSSSRGSSKTSAIRYRRSARDSRTSTGGSATRTAEFPWEFYQAIAGAGWLGITIPREYGGAGLGITEASLVMQTVAESGGGTQACSSIHLGIFGLEPLLKYGTESAKAEVPAGDPERQDARLLRGHGARRGHQHDRDHDLRDAQGRRLRRHRSQGLHHQGARVPEDAAAHAHDADRAGEEEDRRDDALLRRHRSRRGRGPRAPQVRPPRRRHQHALHRQPLRRARGPRRRRRQRILLHSRRHQSRAHPHRRRGDRHGQAARSTAPCATPRSAWSSTARSA